MRTKDKLIESECDEGGMTSGGGGLRKSPNPIRKFCVPTAKLLCQLCLHNLLLDKMLNVRGTNIAKNGKQRLIGHILQGYGDLTARKKKGVGSATPPADQMAEIIQVAIVVQELRRNDGFQDTGLLERTHKTHGGKLLFQPFLPA